MSNNKQNNCDNITDNAEKNFFQVQFEQKKFVISCWFLTAYFFELISSWILFFSSISKLTGLLGEKRKKWIKRQRKRRCEIIFFKKRNVFLSTPKLIIDYYLKKKLISYLITFRMMMNSFSLKNWAVKRFSFSQIF